MSRNSTLRCPASVMYPPAEEPTPDSASADTLSLSVDMASILLPSRRMEVAVRVTNVDIGQRNKGSGRVLALRRSFIGRACWCGLVFAEPRSHQFPRYGEDDGTHEQPDDPMCQGTAD